jgi:hypothetical protein
MRKRILCRSYFIVNFQEDVDRLASRIFAGTLLDALGSSLHRMFNSISHLCWAWRSLGCSHSLDEDYMSGPAPAITVPELFVSHLLLRSSLIQILFTLHRTMFSPLTRRLAAAKSMPKAIPTNSTLPQERFAQSMTVEGHSCSSYCRPKCIEQLGSDTRGFVAGVDR